jgi:hypothetical protein
MSGNCAVELRPGGKLSQKLNLSGLSADEWVYFEAFTRYDTPVYFGIKLKFVNGEKGGGGSLLLGLKPSYERVASGYFLHAAPEGVKIQIKHRGSTGKVMVDTVSVREGEFPMLMGLPVQ